MADDITRRQIPPVGGIGPGGFGVGVPGAGIGGGLNVDASGGLGAGLGGLGFGVPGFAGGFSGPYVPSTPMGAILGVKGDLIVPIVAVGVALFLLLIIVLAVKYALAWKVALIQDLADGGRRHRRDAAAPHLETDSMTQLAQMITSAIYSESCAQRVVCEVGAYARSTKELPAIIKMVESFIPSDYIPSVEILRSSVEGSFECGQKYPCGTGNSNSTMKQDQPGHENSTFSQDNPKMQMQMPGPPGVAKNPMQMPPIPMQVTPRPTIQSLFNSSEETNEIRPQAGMKSGKFRRAVD